MSTIALSAYTPEDLLTMPDGERYELVDGQFVQKQMGAESDSGSGHSIGLGDQS